MRAFVTGAAGFVGGTLIRLLDDGHVVVGVDTISDCHDALVRCGSVGGASVTSEFEFVPVPLS